MNIKQLRKKHEGLLAKGRGLYELAEKEEREVSEPEWTELKQLDTDVAEVLVEIAKAEADGELAERLKATFGQPIKGDGALEGDGRIVAQRQTLGEFFTNNAEIKAWIKKMAPSGYIPESMRGMSSPTVPLPKGIPNLFRGAQIGQKELLTGAGATSAGAFVAPDYTGIYEPIGRYALTALDLVSRRTTGSDTVSFVRETHQVTQAVPVLESNVTEFSGGTGEIEGAKPEVTIRFEEVQLPVQVIAGFAAVTKRAIADASQVQGIIDQELRDDVAEELEDQIINGTGLGANLTGILNTAGVLLQAFNTDIVVTVRQAITTLLMTGRTMATGLLMNPADWETVDLLTDTAGQYYFGGPTRMGVRTLWGVPVAQCMSLAQDQAILGDFRKAILWDREQTTIRVSDSHADFFIRNMVAILAEMRAAFGLISPDSFCVLDLTAGS